MKKIIIFISILIVVSLLLLPFVLKDTEKLDEEQQEIDDLYSEVIVTQNTAPTTSTTQPEEVTQETSVTANSTSTTKKPQIASSSTAPAGINIDKLKKINSDVLGWIFMPNSAVNYPVVMSSGNEYLTKSIYGKKNTSGTIYCYDTQNLSNEKMDKNVVLYGHNMSNGTMFSYIEKLRNNPAILNNAQNRYVYVYTDTSIYKYEIFSVYKANKNDGFHKIHFKDDTDFWNFCSDAIKKSNYKQFSKDITNYTNIITLSTCTNGSDKDARAVLHAVLIEETKNIY